MPPSPVPHPHPFPHLASTIMTTTSESSRTLQSCLQYCMTGQGTREAQERCIGCETECLRELHFEGVTCQRSYASRIERERE